MKPGMIAIASCLTAFLLVGSSALKAQDVAELKAARQSARESVAAYRSQDWKTYEARLIAALEVQPHHPVWLYNLASAAALRSDHTRALALLDTVATFGFAFDPAADIDFTQLRDSAAFRRRTARFAANAERVGASTVAASLRGPEFLPEGVAYDERSGAVFISSVHQRKIVRIEKGKERTLADSSAGLWSVLGIAYAPRTASIWAVTTVFPEMTGYMAGAKGTALVEIDARSGAVRRRVTPSGEGHSFNDLTLDHERGRVYVSDPGTGAVHEWSERDGLRELVAPGWIYSPSGIAVMPGSDWLYVADYSVGLVRVARTSGKVERVSDGAGISTYGIDGLVQYRGDLIAIQNALPPHRIARIVLDRDGARVARLTILERSSPHFDEPTLGVIAGDALLYVANSRWGKFRDGRYTGPSNVSGPVILRLPLSGTGE